MAAATILSFQDERTFRLNEPVGTYFLDSVLHPRAKTNLGSTHSPPTTEATNYPRCILGKSNIRILMPRVEMALSTLGIPTRR